MNTIHHILKQYWGYDQFRPVQEEAIHATLAGNDTLILLPTGGGKSICFQVPVLAMEGVCIVVTPLIALMKDQVEQLNKRNISAAAIHSGMNQHQISIALDNCIHGNTKFLYVSPERLRTDIMIQRSLQMNICLLAVDEAHCISSWGYNFRPSYLMIADFRTRFPKVPVMALTATATEEVRKDIMSKLLMKNPLVFTQSFARANLSYSTFLEENKDRKLLQILRNVPGTSIVYVRTRKRTKDVADFLSKNSLPTLAYHAGLPFQDRTNRQSAWIQNKVRIVVATNAFGMGIDKSDVRTVIHYDLPDTLEAYYQEAGRAGRDQQKAYAVALFNKSDLQELEDAVERKYPPVHVLKRVYQALANYLKIATGAGALQAFSFDIQEFTSIFGLIVSDTHYALKLLEEEGFIQLSENFSESARIHFLVDHRELYDFQIRYPKFDSFIKTLLRMYGGPLYTEYVKISEREIAQMHYAPVDEVQQYLKFLHDSELIDFQPARDKPQICFLTPRYDAEQLPLNIYEIEKRKERDRQKAQSMIFYAAQTQRCRTILLLEYFNEMDGMACGVCDVCLMHKKEEQTHTTTETATAEAILNYLQIHGPILPLALSEAFGTIIESHFLTILQHLIQQEKVQYNLQGKLLINDNIL
jgi:ATP-dependent DNA helicase RecQ